METRLELQSKLEELLGSRHVYYEPPESQKIEYPAIVYSRGRISKENANNHTYLRNKRYELTVIDSRPDNPVIDELLEWDYCSHDRTYRSEKLYHDAFTLYI